MSAYEHPHEVLDDGSFELSHLATLDPFVVGPYPLPPAARIAEDWGYHGGQGEPGTRPWRYTELLAHYGTQDVQRIPEVRRLVEAIWSLG